MLQDWWQQIAGATGLGVVLAWLGRNVLRLDRAKVDHSEIKELAAELKEHSRRTETSLIRLHEKQDETINRLSNLGERVSHIEGRLQAAAVQPTPRRATE